MWPEPLGKLAFSISLHEKKTMSHFHACPVGEWYGYTVGDRTLLCDGSQPCSCQPLKDTVSYIPPCGNSGSCDFNGVCIGALQGDKTPRCSFNNPLLTSTSPNSSIPIPSSVGGSAITTGVNLVDPSYQTCFVALETALAPLLIPLLAEGAFGYIAGQFLVYGAWKSGFGSACTNEINKLQESWAGKSFSDLEPEIKCQVYNDALGWCEASGFKPSKRWECEGGVPPDPSPGPPPLKKCEQKGGICVASSMLLGKCGNDNLCHPCGNDCDDCKTCGDVCTEGGTTGICHDGPGPPGSCGACDPLDAPMCSALQDFVKPPRGCQEHPYFWEGEAKGRQACAPLANGTEKDWVCNLTSGPCPEGTKLCYWSGNW